MTFAKLPKILIALVMAFAAFPIANAQTFSVLYSFKGKSDGALPYGGVIFDSAGNMYGTTASIGFGGFAGSIYELSAEGKFTLLHSFTEKAALIVPVAGLARDSAGNLYGSATNGNPGPNFGGIFKLSEKKTFTELFPFPLTTANASPLGPAGNWLLDSMGNLYGAGVGGASNCIYGACGAIYKMEPDGTTTALHSFQNGKNGCNPNSGLIEDAAGNLYGTTLRCGNKHGDGVVFKIDSAGKYSVLYTFQGSPDGAMPNPGLILDDEGNLYGSTSVGGNTACKNLGCGTIFKLDAAGNETVLYRFTGKADGEGPVSIVRDAKGNLYGPTNGGGSTGFGVIFKLSAVGKETVIHNFAGGVNGLEPVSLTMDSNGDLIGTTLGGGDQTGCTSGGGAGCGIVFKLVP